MTEGRLTVGDVTRAGRWIRVSSGGQDEADQEPAIDRHIAGQGYHVAKTYRLHDVSASKGEQQAAQDEVIADMKRSEIKVLVIWHSDRLERRGVLESLIFLRAVKDAGGLVVSTQEGILTEDNLITIVNAHMNHQKTALMSEHVRKAHNEIRANGGVLGPATWGMTLTDIRKNKRLIGTDEGREWMPQIFDAVIRGMSLAKISLWLAAGGVVRKNGSPFHESTIGAWIRNPSYMGFRCEQDPKTKKYGKIVSIGEVLVSPEVWRKAQESLDSRPKRGYTNPETRAMLAGVLKCGNPECDASGAPDSPMNRNRSSTKFYYRCTGVGAVRKSCGTMVCLTQVDEAVNTIVHKTFDVPRMERRVIPGTDHSADLESLKFELRQLPLQDLPWEAEDAERARLRAEHDRIAALPVIPDREVLTDTGTTYADLWDALRVADRGPWLAAQGFAVRASRAAVTVSQGDVSATITFSG